MQSFMTVVESYRRETKSSSFQIGGKPNYQKQRLYHPTPPENNLTNITLNEIKAVQQTLNISPPVSTDPRTHTSADTIPSALRRYFNRNERLPSRERAKGVNSAPKLTYRTKTLTAPTTTGIDRAAVNYEESHLLERWVYFLCYVSCISLLLPINLRNIPD